MRKHSHGFTLIELLVVIAILAAILFPVFSAREAMFVIMKTAARLKQMG